MQEAFRQAMKQKPDSPLSPVIKDVHQAQAKEEFRQREKKRFARLRQQFFDLGHLWFGTQIDKVAGMHDGYDFIPIEAKRVKWTQALIFLKGRPSEERIELLKAMASGMQLTEESIPTAYKESLLQDVFSSPLSYFSTLLSGVSFTLPSTLFMDALSDMSGHSKKQKQEFRDFMVKKSGLTGKVELPQLFSGISRWIDHSK